MRGGAAHVDTTHVSVGVGAAHDHRVSHPGPDNVVHVASAAGEEAWILHASDASADDVHDTALALHVDDVTFDLH